MENTKGLGLEKQKVFRYYRRITISLIFFILCLSIWTTMLNNVDWTFSDILFELISLVVITISGMFGNVVNNFSLFHLRTIKMTPERLKSVLIGLFFPLVFILYIMITHDSFMQYVRNISLHNFITLLVYSLPVAIIISLIIYLSYVLVGPKYKRCKVPEYEEKIEASLDNYKYLSINVVTVVTFISMWIKVSLNKNWRLDSITTEIVVLLVVFVMKVIANSKNKLKWYHSEKIKINKYFVLALFIPYCSVLISALLSSSFRTRISVLGVNNVISLLVFLLPLFIVIDIALFYILKLLARISDDNKKVKKIPTKKQQIRNENIIISFSLTVISILLLFIYILTNILTFLNMELLLQLFTVLIPLGVIIYLVFYYSIININK